MDTDGIETVHVATLGGADTVFVADLDGTDVKTVDVDLGAADGAADTVRRHRHRRRRPPQGRERGRRVAVDGLSAQFAGERRRPRLDA